ncbi:hypothetical protein ACU2GK_27490, partial [Pseudomonas chlororaphis]
ARTSSIKSAFLFLCFPEFREEPFLCLPNIAPPPDAKHLGFLPANSSSRWEFSSNISMLRPTFAHRPVQPVRSARRGR